MQTKRRLRHASQAILLAAVLLLARAAIASGQNASAPSSKEEAKNAAQFKEFLGDIRRYQYQDQKQYDELWRNTIWSDNERERAVLDILLADQRMYDSSQRYSDVAPGELARLRTPKNH